MIRLVLIRQILIRRVFAAGRLGGHARRAPGVAALCALALSALAVSAEAQPQRPAADHWVGTWATSPVERPQSPPAQTTPAPKQAPLNLADTTVREIVHVSIGGSRARVVLSNAFGTAPLAIGAASVALRENDSNIVKNTGHSLTFGGSVTVMIPAGATMISDAVDLKFPAMSDLAIDLYLPREMLAAASPLTVHAGAQQSNYISKNGNFAGAAELPVASTTTAWFFLSRVETTAPAAANISAIICFGDSITDGTRSTPNTNHRWPDLLAKRLAAKPVSARAILNEAIAGNRLLSEGNLNFGINALARFDRDVLEQPGATHMIVLEGINDIGMGRTGGAPPSSAELIAAHQQLIERAHAHGLKIIGATLTPFEGAAYFTPDGETRRQAINAWMRGGKAGSPSYDGVIDFDAAARDPQNPTKFNPQFDSGDHLHPNDAGYQAMANAIDLKLFEPGAKRR